MFAISTTFVKANLLIKIYLIFLFLISDITTYDELRIFKIFN